MFSLSATTTSRLPLPEFYFINFDSYLHLSFLSLSLSLKWRWPIRGVWPVQSRVPKLPTLLHPIPFWRKSSYLIPPIASIWDYFWVLIIKDFLIVELPVYVAVVSTAITTMKLMIMFPALALALAIAIAIILMNGIGIVGTVTSLKLSKLTAFPLFLRLLFSFFTSFYPFFQFLPFLLYTEFQNLALFSQLFIDLWIWLVYEIG